MYQEPQLFQRQREDGNFFLQYVKVFEEKTCIDAHLLIAPVKKSANDLDALPDIIVGSALREKVCAKTTVKAAVEHFGPAKFSFVVSFQLIQYEWALDFFGISS